MKRNPTMSRLLMAISKNQKLRAVVYKTAGSRPFLSSIRRARKLARTFYQKLAEKNERLSK